MQYCFNPVVSGQTRFLPLDYDDMHNYLQLNRTALSKLIVSLEMVSNWSWMCSAMPLTLFASYGICIL